MTRVQIMPVQNKISTTIGQGRGISASEAIKRGHDAMEAMRVPCMETIEDALIEIERRFGALAADRSREPLPDLYVLSSRIIDLAGFMPDTSIDQAANVLCELVDQSIVANRTPWEAVDVCINALQLLKRQGAYFSADQRAAIIIGLQEVIANRFTSAPAPSAPGK